MDLRCSCGESLRIPDRLLRKHIRCPGCGSTLGATVPPGPDRPPETADQGIAHGPAGLAQMVVASVNGVHG
jgi:hypothetical protein